MAIILFTHPHFLGSQSMPRYAQWLKSQLEARGYSVQIWSPKAKAYNLPAPKAFKKWLGYVDQYWFFPKWAKEQMKRCSRETLFVFTDNALGPWVHLAANRPHVIHCHDFLAQQSALGLIKENPTGWTGRIYQSYIRKGFKLGRNFISVSENTRSELHKFLKQKPTISQVVYNALTQPFQPTNVAEGMRWLASHSGIDLSNGYILHVGGNQWYKNRAGVIEIYDRWRGKTGGRHLLLLVGAPPTEALKAVRERSEYKDDIHFLTGRDDEFVRKVYACAAVFLFPSLAEGFGWPIAEAMASGTPVITTASAPMTEVAGNAAFTIEVMPTASGAAKQKWTDQSADVLEKLVQLDADAREAIIAEGYRNVQRFNSTAAIEKIESIYKEILKVD